MNSIDISHCQEIYTISRLNREVKYVLESNFPFLWLEGEISNFTAASSGHWYFCLKDANAQIRCAMFKTQNKKLNLNPKDGMHVIAKARVSLYEGRGEFQLIIEHFEEAGIGKLQREFEALKNRLAAAGLFDPIHKKPLPKFPKQIGVITSPTGAAIRDILSVLQRRFACLPVIIYPTLVQGSLAAGNIVEAINIANSRQECDVLILARGGGSLEDLWSFNEEIVANAIFKSTLPIISGVGHEVDFTIADFVADCRAPTPSAAAELITPDCGDLSMALFQNQRGLIRNFQEKLKHLSAQLQWMQKHLYQQHPKNRIQQQLQFLDHAELNLVRSQFKKISEYTARIKMLSAQFIANNPSQQIQRIQHHLTQTIQFLKNKIEFTLQKNQEKIATFAATLDAVSPLSTLKRGYVIASNNTKILRRKSEVAPGDKIALRFIDGETKCTIDAE